MKMIVANWKMNVGVRESVALARATLLTLRGRLHVPELVVCPPFVALTEVRKVVARSAAALGAQDVFWKDAGPFTGEISGRMLTETGVTYVIIGHAERRVTLGETDAMVNHKVLYALQAGLTPVVCVGETQTQREAGETTDVVRGQVSAALASVRLRASDKLFIAYEPVWAIGGGACSVGEALEIHRLIRPLVAEILPQSDPRQCRVLYGGSVNGENAHSFLREREVDGVLVGGASVKINQFKDVVAAACEVMAAQTPDV